MQFYVDEDTSFPAFLFPSFVLALVTSLFPEQTRKDRAAFQCYAAANFRIQCGLF